MVITICFFTMADELFCQHKINGGMAAAVSYVETLKQSFVISSVNVHFPNLICIKMGGSAA